MTKTASILTALVSSFAAADVSAQAAGAIVLDSPTLSAGQPMPRDHTPDGRNESPPLSWGGLPAGTRQLALICEDHGAGNPPPWVHWIVYGIPATAGGLPAAIPFDPADAMPVGLEGVRQGNNGWGLAMYRGPAPPSGTAHEYTFTLFALDAELDLPAGLTRTELLAAVEGHVLERATFTATYARTPAEGGAAFD
ncbi:MAG: YbhB/YbcL family Raf kinase inhibitor-like protein [Gemmatimonadales bacterium]